MSARRAIVVYDGDCVFCSRSMAWIAAHDGRRNVALTACTSETGMRLMREHGIDPLDPSTFLAVVDGMPYVRSAAMLALVPLLDAGAQPLRAFGIVPAVVRDAVYDWTARNRRRLVRGACPAPTAAMRERIVA